MDMTKYGSMLWLLVLCMLCLQIMKNTMETCRCLFSRGPSICFETANMNSELPVFFKNSFMITKFTADIITGNMK